MAVEPGDAGFRIEAHGFDQVVPAGGAAREPALDLTFAPFGHAVTVGNDGSADAEHGLMPIVLPRSQANRPDRDVERGIAVRVDAADRAAIRAARVPRSEEHTSELQSRE